MTIQKMHRFEKYTFIINSNLSSKTFYFLKRGVKLNSLMLTAGLYKFASITLEHALMLTSITGSLASLKSQLHGKRKKVTLTFNVTLTGSSIWWALDKLVNELLPKLNDFKSLKFRRKTNSNYTVRLKQKFTPLPDFQALVDSTMYDRNKGIFLPLTVHLHLLKGLEYSLINEHYLRMLRLPVSFYTRNAAPAFDDSVKFS